MENVLNKILEKLNELLEAIKRAFKPSSDNPGTTPLPNTQKPPVEAPGKPETHVERPEWFDSNGNRGPMHPASVLGLDPTKPDGSANPTLPFRGNPAHPMYKVGDGEKIRLVGFALQDGVRWDKYITDRGWIWDLDVPPDHPSIGFTIPKDK